MIFEFKQRARLLNYMLIFLLPTISNVYTSEIDPTDPYYDQEFSNFDWNAAGKQNSSNVNGTSTISYDSQEYHPSLTNSMTPKYKIPNDNDNILLNYDYSRFTGRNSERIKQIFEDLSRLPNCRYLVILSNLLEKTINMLDKNDFSNMYKSIEDTLAYNSAYENRPKIEEIKIIEDSLNNPKFNLEKIDPNFDEENRYVKCNISDITGWVNLNIINLIKKLQKPTYIDYESPTAHIPFANKIILHGPPGNGKTTLVEKMAELSDSHLIKITGSSLHSEFANQGAKKIQEYFAKALLFAGSHKYKKVIIFIDEADSFAKYNSNKTNQGANYQLATTQELWQSIDKIRFEEQIFVILATNNYELLHPTLTSRFNTNIIQLSNPSKNIRREIINYYIKLFKISLFQHEIDNIILKTEGFGIRDIELLFISAYEKINSVNVETDEILKKSKPTLIKIIDTRLKAANKELEKRKKNEENENLDEKIKIRTSIIQKYQIQAYKVGEFSVIGGAIGASIGSISGAILAGKDGFREGMKMGTTAGVSIGTSLGYLYYKGWLSKAYNYANKTISAVSKDIILSLTFVMLLEKIHHHMNSHNMIPSKL